MKRREFLKRLAASGVLATSGGSLSALLATCTNEEKIGIEEHYSFLDHFDSAQISSTIGQHVKKTAITVNREQREVLFAPPETEIVFSGVPVYRDARLSFGAGIDEEAWGKECNGVLFEVVIADAKGKQRTVYSRFLDPANNAGDQKWVEGNVGLHDYHGKTVSITFKTSSGPRGPAACDWPGWSRVDLVSHRIWARKEPCESDNIILITIDTLRHDYLGCYGNASIKTPTLDRIAREGVLCRHAFSHSHITLPSHLSIMTSLYPKDHQVRSNIRQELHPNVVTMAQHLKNAGYRTAAVVSVEPLTPEWIRGIERGFDEFLIPKEVERRAEQTNQEVFKWLMNHCGEKFFLWVHYFDPHMPYTPPPPYNTRYYQADPRRKELDTMQPVRFPRTFYMEPHNRLIQWLDGIKDITYPRSQYAGEVSYVDFHLGELMAFLQKAGLDRKTLLAITADHGEALGEHNIYFDHKGLYDQTMQVPLILRYSGRLKAGKVNGLVGSVDIMPTLFEIVGIDTPSAIRGNSLLPLMQAGQGLINTRIYGEHVNESQSMLRTRKWKFIKSFRDIVYHEKFKIIAGNMELYDVQKDPAELNNVAQLHPEVVARFSEDVDAWLKDKRVSAALPNNLMDEESKATLRALGYAD